jgi:2,4-dienoyl-CoA reductase (NADPH2)
MAELAVMHPLLSQAAFGAIFETPFFLPPPRRYTLNYGLEINKVKVHLNKRVGVSDLTGFDEVIIATGVKPRDLKIEGGNHPKVLSYVEVLKGLKPVGKSVAVIGAGGIGFDVSEFLSHEGESTTLNKEKWMAEWNIDITKRGGLAAGDAGHSFEPSHREIFLLQRKKSKHGKDLGKTTGWIHRATLINKKVKMIGGVSYDKVDDAGLHITVDGKKQILNVDNVVVCAGQEPLKDLVAPLTAAGVKVKVIGGADVAAELDAKRAIKQGAEVAAAL